jgi:hypothetical protein
MPNPPHEASFRFLDFPELCGFPVKVFKAGTVELTYSFLSNEGTKTKGTLKLDFLEVTPL